MDENEITSIVAEQWLGQPSANKAVIMTCSEVGKKILEELIGKRRLSLATSDRKILFRMNGAKSTINYFRSLGPINILDEFHVASLRFLFDAWKGGLRYLYAHHDDIRPGAKELRRTGTKKELRKVMNKVIKLIQAHISGLTEIGHTCVSVDEFKKMDEIFGLVMLFILGKKGFSAFIAEFNGTVPVLRKVLTELDLSRRPLFFPHPRKDRTVN